MDLELKRMTPTTTAVIGTLRVNGQFECFTLENPEVIIPAGTYGLDIYSSPHAGHDVPLLLDVPGRSYIEVHSGNLPCDSKGCILVGQLHTTGSLIQSRLAFAHLFPQIAGAVRNQENVTMTITDMQNA